MARNLKDAFYNAQYRVGQGIFTRAVSQGDNSLTESNFTANDTFDTLIEDDTGALPEFVDSQISMSDAASNGVAINKISASQTAMDAVAASQTAMDAVISSQLALDTVVASQTAMDAVAASQTAMDAVAASQTARDVIGFSGLAYDTIANSNLAIGKYAIGYTTESPSDFADMDAVVASQTAMDAVSASQTAMDAVAASQTAMDAVNNSSLARDAIFNGQYPIKEITDSNMFPLSGKGYPTEVFTGTSQNQGQHDTTAYSEIIVNFSGTIHWDVTVSSEDGFDFGRIKKNGTTELEVSGTTSNTGSVNVSPGDVIRVEYQKDGSNNKNDDEFTVNELYWSLQ